MAGKISLTEQLGIKQKTGTKEDTGRLWFVFDPEIVLMALDLSRAQGYF
jgi:hypothetical protein